MIAGRSFRDPQLKSQVTNLTTKARRPLLQKSKDSDPECSVSKCRVIPQYSVCCGGEIWRHQSCYSLNRNLSFTSCNLLRLKVIKKALSTAVLLFSKIHFLDHRASKDDCCGRQQKIWCFISF